MFCPEKSHLQSWICRIYLQNVQLNRGVLVYAVFVNTTNWIIYI